MTKTKKPTRAIRRLKGKNFGEFEMGMSAFTTGNYKEALHYLLPIAERGWGEAQCVIANMYLDGKGVPKDCIRAYMWADLAVLNRDETADRIRDLAVKEMSSDEIAKAEGIGNAWRCRCRR